MEHIIPHLGPEIGNPTRLRVPDGHVGILPHHPDFDRVLEAFRPLPKERDWFVPHAYRCLPLVMGNQLGFAVHTFYAFTVCWLGGDQPHEVQVTIPDGVAEGLRKLQTVEPHFGMGTFTVQFRATLRTPPGVNLLVLPPPNQIKKGVWPMTALVEADNLRRDFTFNIRLTEPARMVQYQPGDMIAALLPVPRGFPDQFELADLRDLAPADVIEEELKAQTFAAFTRSQADPSQASGVGRMYMRGLDPFGHPFPEHQLRPATLSSPPQARDPGPPASPPS